MALPQDEQGNVMVRSFIGFVKSTEVPFFEEQFNDPEVRAQFPDDLVFKWSFDETEDGFVTLYALRGVNGKSPSVGWRCN